MIVILKQNPSPEKLEALVSQLKASGLEIYFGPGSKISLIGLIGDTSRLDIQALLANDIVEKVKRLSDPYTLVNRKLHPRDMVIDIGGCLFGDGNFSVIAGPCTIESEEQILEAAHKVKAAGASCLRGGAFKPRTSPYAFRGLGAEGLKLLIKAKKETGLPIVSELTDLRYLDLYEDVDIIQVGARNMQNFELLSQLGQSQKPILLKRGPSSTLEDLLMSAEYIALGGNEHIILCERGIRTFETSTRNTLDISAIPVLKKMTHLPVIIDPSHASGLAYLIKPLSKAAVVIGADGLMVEVHPQPQLALCDGAQSVAPGDFEDIMADIKKLCLVENKKIFF